MSYMVTDPPQNPHIEDKGADHIKIYTLYTVCIYTVYIHSVYIYNLFTQIGMMIQHDFQAFSDFPGGWGSPPPSRGLFPITLEAWNLEISSASQTTGGSPKPTK